MACFVQTYLFLVPNLAVRCLRRLVVFPSSAFQNIFDEPPTLTASLFEGKPLAALSPKARGEILAKVARSVDSDLNPNARICDAIPGVCINGSRRGCYSAEYDWLRDTTRIECKSSQMRWDKCKLHWKFGFRAIKLPYNGNAAAFDDLHLVFYTPQHVHVCRHDSLLGVSRSGVLTESQGHEVALAGPRGEQNWHLALERILGKIDSPGNTCERIADLPLNDLKITCALAERSPDITGRVFSGMPLAGLTPAVRGTRIQDIVRALDSKLHLNADISDAVAGMRCDGNARGWHMAAYDWGRNGVRIECKSGQLLWRHAHLSWAIRFTSIKFNEFDELYLTAYTPRGLHVYRYDSACAATSNGKATATKGYTIEFIGPMDEQDWSTALDTILHKMEKAGCEHVAQVAW